MRKFYFFLKKKKQTYTLLSGMPQTAEQLTQVALIFQTVQQVSAVTAAATSFKKSKKTSFKDEVSDASSL
jgi:hypothetical protein